MVNAVVMSTEGVALWGQEKTRIARHKLEDKFNVFKEDEFVEDVEPIDPKTIQVRNQASALFGWEEEAEDGRNDKC